MKTYPSACRKFSIQCCIAEILNTHMAKNLVHDVCQKTGDSAKTNNWRPIAILNTTYKIFTKTTMEDYLRRWKWKQSCHQTGVRPHTVLKMHSLFFKPSVAKPKNGIAPLVCKPWFEQGVWSHRIWFFLEALQQQHVPKSYCALLWNLYRNQKGCIFRQRSFLILKRGVQQSDVISPLLFNAGVEHALRKWKRKSKKP